MRSAPAKPTRRHQRRWAVVLGVVVIVAVMAGTAAWLIRPRAIDFRGNAELAAKAGDLDAAIIEYKNLLQRSPQDLEARRRLGQLYLAQRQPRAALKELRRASALRGKFPDLNLDLARAHLALDAPREALAALSIYTGPRSSDVIALEATARAAAGDTARAQAVLDAAVKRDPDAVGLQLATARLALSAHDLDGATAAIDKAAALAPDAREVHLLKGRVAMAAQRAADAAVEFEGVLDTEPRDIEALAGLAEALLAQTRADAAAKIVQRLRAMAPNSPNVRLYEGWVAYLKQDWAGADAAFADLLKKVPAHPAGLLMAADSAFRQDRYAQAEALLERFTRHYPDHLPAQRLLAAVLLKQQRAPDALRLLEPLAAADTRDPALQVLLGQAYFEAGDAAKGEAALATAEKLAPDSPALGTQRAVGRLLAGDAAAGVSELEQIIEREPQDPTPRQALAYVELLGGNAQAALESARALVALRPTDPRAQHLLGVAAAEAGDEAAARAALAAALKLDSKLAPALATLGQIELRAGHRDEGKARLEAALAADRRYAPAALALAALANAEDRRADADAVLERFIADDPQASEVRWRLALNRLLAGDAPSALKLADAALALAPDHPRNRLLWSYVKLRAGDAATAYARLADLRDERPDDPVVILLYAEAARATKRTDEARAAYTAAAERSPTAVEPWRGLFTLALDEQDWPAAERAIGELRQRTPQAPEADAATAALAARRGRPADAVVALEAAFAKDAVTLRLLQLVDAERHAGAKAQANARLAHWLEQHPGDVMAREAQGMAALHDGDLPGARDAFEAVVDARPDHAVALNNLAWLYDEAGDPRALDYAERARQQLPDRAETADTLGWILVRQGQVQRGLRLIEQAKTELGDEPAVHYHHAWALDAAGEKAAARASVDALLKRFAQFPQRADAERLQTKLRERRS